MAQEPTVLLWCDIHLDEGEREPAQTRRWGDREMELCKVCEDQITVSNLDGYFERLGRKAGNNSAKPKKVAAPKAEEYVEIGETDLICPYGCKPAKAKGDSMEFASNRGLRMHVTREHG